MRILFLSHYYTPEVNAPASRLSEHAQFWKEAGCEVTVVTCAPNHPNGVLYPGYRNRAFSREKVAGIDVVRLWTFLAANEGFLPRILNYMSYLVSVLFWRWRLPIADIVISTSPQFFCGLSGWLFQSRRRPWVLEIRDLWPESIVAVGAMKSSSIIRFLERLERWAYRRADLIVSVTDSFVDHIKPLASGTPISVLKNGVALAAYTGAHDHEADTFRTSHDLNEKFLAAYVGTIGMAHGLQTILDAAEITKSRPDIVFLLVGDGADMKNIEQERQRRNLTNVKCIGRQPKEAMPVIWHAADAALVLLKPSDTFKKVIPSKMFEAMAAQRPIVLGVEGEALDLLQQSRGGIGISPGDATQLATEVIKLADDRGLADALGRNGREFVTQNFCREKLALDYLALLKSLKAAKR
jgi:colanic acid biosynthesis glycosyl transferase WcaI